MMDGDEPKIVMSGDSQLITIDGYPFCIEIHKLEGDKTWTLEVVDHEGTSHVWDDSFASDKDALNAALYAIESEGAEAFVRGDGSLRGANS